MESIAKDNSTLATDYSHASNSIITFLKRFESLLFVQFNDSKS